MIVRAATWTVVILLITLPESSTFSISIVKRLRSCRRPSPPTYGSRSPMRRPNPPTCGSRSPVQATLHSENQNPEGNNQQKSLSRTMLETFKLVGLSFLISLLLISWEDVSMTHPMRQQSTTSHHLLGSSTVRGLGFGLRERQSQQLDDIEPQVLRELPSYNEVMLQHRTERIPLWDYDNKSGGEPITKRDVQLAVQTTQRALIFLLQAKNLATNYEWDDLTTHVRSPLLHDQLEHACTTLKRANVFLSPEARDEIGFDWGRYGIVSFVVSGMSVIHAFSHPIVFWSLSTMSCSVAPGDTVEPWPMRKRRWTSWIMLLVCWSLLNVYFAWMLWNEV
jgi:hypothetical protein